MPDPEHILTLAQEERWAEAWAAVHAGAGAVAADERLAWAAATLRDAFFERLEAGPVDDGVADGLETVVLLHSGRIYRLSEEGFQEAVTRLVAFRHAEGDLPAARRYARFCPEAPACRAVLEDASGAMEGDGAAAPPVALDVESVPIDHPLGEAVQVSATVPLTSADSVRSLFRSPLERAFFLAVRDVFPTFTPYPNVALKSVVDADRLRLELSGSERSYLYTAVVDCVLFDPHDDYRPVAFFELDSAHHDAPDRQHRDAMKDRILALAGHRLVRLRPQVPDVTHDDFVRLLRALGAQCLFDPAA